MRARGFSLMEVMIAVAIVAFITAVLGGSLVRQLDAKERIAALAERQNTARMALTRMAREISMAFLSKHYNCNERRSVTLFKGKQNGELTFTSFSHYKWTKDANESDQNEITYSVKADPDGGNKHALFRKEAQRITDDPGEAGKDYVLAHDISSLEFEYYNFDNDTWESDWDTTRSEKKFKLPLLVKLTLKLPFPDGKDQTFVTQSRIMLQDALHFGANTCIN